MSSDSSHNYGPVIGALFFIAFVTAGSLAVARYCVGDQAFYRTGYDLDGYVQRKFAVCLGTGRGKARAEKKKKARQDHPEAAVEEVTASEPPAEEEEEENAAAGAAAAAAPDP
jgi:hypothetical protein